MKKSRRAFIKGSAIGIIGLAGSGAALSSNLIIDRSQDATLFYRYPALDDEEVKKVVSASHSRFDEVKELVTRRPELANATWDWGFGDFETALGAASHMARVDIASFLMENGARPDIFTFAMLGHHTVVKAMIEASPGLQQIPGPHGITLLQHAKNRLRRNTTSAEKNRSEKLIDYLEKLGDADLVPINLEISSEEQELFIGEYQFGKEDDEVFVVDLNMRKMLQIGRKGEFGKPLNRMSETEFSPAGAPSVTVEFRIGDGKASSLSVNSLQSSLVAKRI